MKLRPNAIGIWRNRFATYGLAGLHDQARSGKSSTYGHPVLRQRMLEQLEMPPPARNEHLGRRLSRGKFGRVCWQRRDTTTAASVLVRQHRPGVCRRRDWPVPQPAHNALVLRVDEKPSVQAIERTCGYYIHTSSGKIVRGTLNLFAALQVATGQIHGKTTATKKRVDFQAFLDEVIAQQPEGREIHIILDNLSTHKGNIDWLAAHPNVMLHFTEITEGRGNTVRNYA